MLRRCAGRGGASAAAARCNFTSALDLLLPPSPTLDLTSPGSWYPIARALERRIVAHVGPTNSGKTHQALAALSAAASGVYCGPLRLLAWEVAEKLNAAGLPCSLVTGQEVRRVPGAGHTACTVEMAPITRRIDAAVLDEVQLMGDATRGWAFTRALLGVPARELHVCGDPAMLPLLRALCAEMHEALEVREYQRLSPLRAGRRPLGRLADARAGDCVVAFSRREVHAVRQQVEVAAGRRCAVVYGGLPPEARSQQARLFNAPRSGASVLAATDAVGMGLNLQIRRVVFSSLTKFDGVQERPLTAAEVKQIAGRAGRYGGRYASGEATTLHEGDLPALRQALAAPSEPVRQAAVFPRFQQLAAFAGGRPQGGGLPAVLDAFAAGASLGRHYFFARHEDVRTNAVMLRHLPLTLRESYLFALAPCDPGDGPAASALLAMATAFSRRHPVTPALVQIPPLGLASSAEELAQLEQAHRVYDLFIWLSYRFEEAFEGREEAEAARALTAAFINESIRRMGPAAPPPKRLPRALADALPGAIYAKMRIVKMAAPPPVACSVAV